MSEIEDDGAVTLYPNLEQPAQEIWETGEFIKGMRLAIKGYSLEHCEQNLQMYSYEYALFRRGWNFGDAIVKPLLARIEMEKD